MEDVPMPDGQILLDVIKAKMPFGKYKGIGLGSLPVSYLEWFSIRGFPNGKLGRQLLVLYEIKLNGLDSLLTTIEKELSGKQM